MGQTTPEPTRAAPGTRAGEAARPLLDRALAALADAGAAWCLLRGQSESAASGGDVDILVAEDAVPPATRALEALGFVRISGWGRGSHRFFVGYDAPSDTWVKLDVVTELSFGPGQALRTGAAAEVLARRQRDGDLFVPAPSDAFWCLLSHCLLDRRSVAERHRPVLQKLAAHATTDGTLPRLLDEAGPPGSGAAALVRAALDGQWDSLAAVAPEIRSGLRRRASIASWWRTLSRAALRRLTRLEVAVARRGLSVALLGFDGAGKSTLAEGLACSFFLPARVRYVGLYRRRRERLCLPGCAFAYRLGLAIQAGIAARYHTIRGRLVVFDRFTYDALLPAQGRRPGLRRRILANAGGKPDIVLVLDVPPAAALARKGERDEGELASQQETYLALAASLPDAVVLDASKSADAVRRDAIGVIWSRYAHR